MKITTKNKQYELVFSKAESNTLRDAWAILYKLRDIMNDRECLNLVYGVVVKEQCSRKSIEDCMRILAAVYDARAIR